MILRFPFSSFFGPGRECGHIPERSFISPGQEGIERNSSPRQRSTPAGEKKSRTIIFGKGRVPSGMYGQFPDSRKKEWNNKNYFLEPAALTTVARCSAISAIISTGNPTTISSSAIPENLREPSQPREKFGLPLRRTWAVASEQTD